MLCQSKDCKARGSPGKLFLQSRGSKFIKFQEMKIQELVRCPKPLHPGLNYSAHHAQKPRRMRVFSGRPGARRPHPALDDRPRHRRAHAPGDARRRGHRVRGPCRSLFPVRAPWIGRAEMGCSVRGMHQIFLPTPYTGFKAIRAGLLADTFLEAHSIEHMKKRYIDFVLTEEQAETVNRLKNGAWRRPPRGAHASR